MSQLTIDIVSDVVCPFCSIGYARLQQALAQLPELDVNIQWRAFELNPGPKSQPEPVLQALCKKYGASEADMRANQQRIVQAATELGLDFSGMEKRYTCSTFDAHRLLKWAADSGKQTVLKQVLFEATFGQGVSVDDEAVLLSCVVKAGLDQQAAREVLHSQQFAEQVQTEQEQYRQAGINSVPAFIINQQYLISGAQDPAHFVEVLQKINAEQAASA